MREDTEKLLSEGTKLPDQVRLHSRFAPSSLERILACPPSVLLAELRAAPPPPPSPWAAEGTVAHQLAADILTDNKHGLQLDDRVAVPPHEVLVDDDMFLAAYAFADFIKSLKGARSDRIWLEQVVRLDRVVGLDAGCYGHLDAAVWHPSEGLLDLADFKYGRGVVVQVQNNPQLYAYALGAMHTLMSPAELRSCARVRLHVMQPRLGDAGLHTITLSRQDLEDWGEQVLRPVIRAIVEGTLDEHAPLTPGEHCRWCPVMQECPALHAQAQALARQVFSNGSGPEVLEPLDNVTLGHLLDQAEIIMPFIEHAKALAQTRMEMGGTVPGWKLVAKRGHRVWTAPEEEVISELANWGMPGEDIWAPAKIRSAAQLEKLVPTRYRDAFRTLWRMESPGVTLAPQSDARAEKLPDATKVFASTDQA